MRRWGGPWGWRQRLKDYAPVMLAGAGLLLMVLVLAPPARAVDLPNPIAPVGGAVGDAILDKICPPREAPYPSSPGDPVIKRGGGPGLYAQYGYAGLRWTTWDAGCLSWDKADTSIGTQINTAANGLDELINEVQIAALDDSTTASFDTVIERAVVGLRTAFWNPWSMAGLAMVGLLLVLYVVSGRESDALGAVASAAVVVLVMFTLFTRPGMPADVGNGLTSGVAQKVAESLIAATPGGTMPASATPEQKFGEGYYQVSYRAWLSGWSCGDTDAEERYGLRLLDAQAFSVQQFLSTRANPEAATALVKAKNEAWVKIGEEMEQTNPVAFGCWKGAGQGRTSAAVKHAVVTLSAGFWIILGSVTLLALKWVLRLAVLFAVAFGALMLFWRRMQDRMMEFVLLGLLGPPFIAAGVGVLLWGYYAILLNPEQSWWQAGVSAFALGMAVWFGKGMIQRLFVGVHEAGRSSHLMRSSGRKVKNAAGHYGVGKLGGAPGGSAGAAAGGMAAAGAAGAAAALAVQQAQAANTDGRRADADPHDPHDPTERSDMDSMDAPRPADAPDHGHSAPRPGRGGYDDRWVGSDAPDAAPGGADGPRDAPDDAPAQALARARQMAAARGHSPAGFPQEWEGSWAPPERPGGSSADGARTPSVDDVRWVVTGDPEATDPDT